jgi:MbtH protein
MAFDEEDAGRIYKAVVNHEEQYSIWPVGRVNPAGWRDAGREGPKSEVLAYIKEVWTDMRPLSLRKQMEAAESGNNPS